MSYRNVRTEKFSSDQEATIQVDFERMTVMAAKTCLSPLPISKWFGAANRVTLRENLKRMRLIINDVKQERRTITFVNRSGKKLRVEYKSLYNPVPSTPVDVDKVCYAYAFPVDRRNENLGLHDTLAHVGSGMRIYLSKNYFDLPDVERSATMYHEMTHKVLATEDYRYDEEPCRNLTATPEKAIKNADNYTLFLMDC